ncbi:sulfatase [Prosthecobacter sp. SYSU 5D2]|uniref:sulfatase n=1 Tax=Prosthecobacter sp. SYSU 5D2 TaxID=3134134 RepID=UPI0031FEC766
MKPSRLLLIALLLAPLAALAQARPNVLLIMADDFRDFGGAFTKDVVKTPNLDRLRARGTTFERAYVQYPVCNPSRCSMMTGLRAEQTGIVGNDVPLRQRMPDVITLPQLFKEAGWQAHAFGKLYHLGGGRDVEARQQWMDAGRSWHTAQAFEATKTGRKMLEGRDVTAGALKWCHWGAADGTDDDQPDGQIAAATVAMIQKAGDTPWFIGCGFMKPHDPFIAPKKYFDMYPPDSLKPWTDPADMTPVRKEHVSSGDYAKAFGKFTAQEWRELFRAYCACTSFMDAQLGRVLDALDKKQLWDKTVIVFVGDHGYHTGERQWWNKNTLFERSCRAPLIIAAPGMKGGRTTHSFAEFVDVYPTVADFCGLKMPHAGAGASLRPVLADPAASIKDAAFTLLVRNPNLHAQSVRTARWRFTRWSDGRTELFDHAADPEELRDVSAQHGGTIAELTARLQTLPPFTSK